MLKNNIRSWRRLIGQIIPVNRNLAFTMEINNAFLHQSYTFFCVEMESVLNRYTNSGADKSFDQYPHLSNEELLAPYEICLSKGQ